MIQNVANANENGNFPSHITQGRTLTKIASKFHISADSKLEPRRCRSVSEPVFLVGDSDK